MQFRITQRVKMEWFRENLPHATKLSIRILDSDVQQSELRDEIEKYLDTFHTLQVGNVFQISLENAGGWVVQVLIEKVEPDIMGIVKIGGEVEVEFLESYETDAKLESVESTFIPQFKGYDEPIILPDIGEMEEGEVDRVANPYETNEKEGRTLAETGATIPQNMSIRDARQAWLKRFDKTG
jgi:hypothetical protein